MGARHQWTTAEVAFLRRCYRSMPVRDVARALGLSENSVRCTARSLGLSRDGAPRARNSLWTEDEERAIADMRESGKGWREIGKALGRTHGACCMHFYEMKKREKK